MFERWQAYWRSWGTRGCRIEPTHPRSFGGYPTDFGDGHRGKLAFFRTLRGSSPERAATPAQRGADTDQAHDVNRIGYTLHPVRAHDDNTYSS
jgi:hypothetical protein